MLKKLWADIQEIWKKLRGVIKKIFLKFMQTLEKFLGNFGIILGKSSDFLQKLWSDWVNL